MANKNVSARKMKYISSSSNNRQQSFIHFNHHFREMHSSFDVPVEDKKKNKVRKIDFRMALASSHVVRLLVPENCKDRSAT